MYKAYSANYIRISIKSRKNAQNKTSFTKYVQFLYCLFIFSYNLSVKNPYLKVLKIEAQYAETSAPLTTCIHILKSNQSKSKFTVFLVQCNFTRPVTLQQLAAQLLHFLHIKSNRLPMKFLLQIVIHKRMCLAVSF